MWFWQEWTTAFPCLCLQRTVKNKQKQIMICSEHTQFPRWHAFNFARIPSWSMFGMLSKKWCKANILKPCIHKVWFKFHYLKFTPWPHACQSRALPVQLFFGGFQWNVAWVSFTSLLSTAAEQKLNTALTSGNKGRWWVLRVGHLMC